MSVQIRVCVRERETVYIPYIEKIFNTILVLYLVKDIRLYIVGLVLIMRAKMVESQIDSSALIRPCVSNKHKG